jgi:hypothetical protein
MFLGDCWQKLPPKEKTPHGNDKARPNATKDQIKLLMSRKEPRHYLSGVTGVIPPRGVVRSDSNDCFLDRHIVNTKHNKYPEPEASTHNNAPLEVNLDDQLYEFDRFELGLGFGEEVFPPATHELEDEHHILTCGVHSHSSLQRDEKMWGNVAEGEDDTVRNNYVRYVMAKKALIPAGDVIFCGNDYLRRNRQYQAACDQNPIFKALSIYPYLEPGDINICLYRNMYSNKMDRKDEDSNTTGSDGEDNDEEDDDKNNEKPVRPASGPHKGCWLQYYHHMKANTEPGLERDVGVCHPCHKPGFRNGRPPKTISFTGNCMCLSILAKIAQGGF